MVINETVLSVLAFIECPLFFTDIQLPYYGTLTRAINYFGTRLRTQVWDCADKDDRVKALHEATRLIDRLYFVGKKADPNQALEFPRVSNAVNLADLKLITVNICIPPDIEVACYEIALKLQGQASQVL